MFTVYCFIVDTQTGAALVEPVMVCRTEVGALAHAVVLTIKDRDCIDALAADGFEMYFDVSPC